MQLCMIFVSYLIHTVCILYVAMMIDLLICIIHIRCGLSSSYDFGLVNHMVDLVVSSYECGYMVFRQSDIVATITFML